MPAEPQPREIGKIEVRNGDKVKDGKLTRAGLRVVRRGTLVDPDVGFGKGEFVDTVQRPDGTGRHHRYWTDYPHGAFMAVPIQRERGQKSLEAVVYIGTNMQLYGVGETDGTEVMGGRTRPPGHETRTAEKAARELMADKGFEIGEVNKIAVVRETTSRSNNPTDIVRLDVLSAPGTEILEEQNVLAHQLGILFEMIDSGVITNAASIAALYHIDRWAQNQYMLEDFADNSGY